MKYGEQVKVFGIILCGVIFVGGIFFGIFYFSGSFFVFMGSNSMELRFMKMQEHNVEEMLNLNETDGTFFYLNLTHTNLSPYRTFQKALIDFYDLILSPLSNKTRLNRQIPKDEYNRVRSELLFLYEYINEYSGELDNYYYPCLAYYDCYINYDWSDNAPM